MQRSIGLWILAAAFSFSIYADILPAADWPQWRGPNRDGISPETGIDTDWKSSPPRLLWQVEGLGQGYAGVSVSGRRIYTTGNFPGGQAFIAIDGQTGKLAWRTPLTDGVPKHGYEGARCTPAIDGDRVYAVSSGGTIYCCNANTGKILWKRDFSDWGGKMMSGWGFSESPLVDGDVVICSPGGPRGQIVALNKINGRDVWATTGQLTGQNGGDGAGYSSVVISNAAGVKQYVQLMGRGVIGVRADDGELLWQYNRVANSTANIPTPLVKDDLVFCSTGYGTGAALLRLSPGAGGTVNVKEEYFLSSGEFQNHHGGMVLVGDHVYAGHGHNKGFPICLELESGDVQWTAERESRNLGSGSAAVLYIDDHLVFRYQSGQVVLIAADPEKFTSLGSFTPPVVNEPAWAHPSIADGKLYLRDQDVLMCYQIAK